MELKDNRLDNSAYLGPGYGTTYKGIDLNELVEKQITKKYMD